MKPASGSPTKPLIPPLAAEGVCLLLALAALQPLLTPGYQWGHDTGAHLFRIVEVARALKEGVVYPRFLPDAYGGLGGPILNFNPVLPYYYPALLVLLGAGPIAALKVTAGTAMIAGGAAVAIFARPHAGRVGGAVAGLAYVFLPYRLADIYVRMAYSELVAMVFLALALAAARRAARRPTRRRAVLLAIFIALILATHFPTSVIGLPVVFLYALVSSLKGRRVRGVLSFAAASALGISLSAFSWLPAIAEQAGTHYADSASGYDNYRNHFLSWPQLFSTRWGFGQSLPGSEDQMSFQIGWVHVIALLIAVAAAFRLGRLRRIVGFASAIVMGGSALMLTAAQPLWDRLPIVQNVQFPWRILMVVGMGTSLAAGIVAALPSLVAERTGGSEEQPGPSTKPRSPGGGGRGGTAAGSLVRLAVPIAVALIFVAACLPYITARAGEGNDADFTPEAIRRQYFGELKFQPKEVAKMRFVPEGPRALLLDPAGAPLASGSAAIVEERTHRTIVDVDAPVPATLRLHLLDTPGWKAATESGELPVRSEPGTALVLVDVPAGRHSVVLRFADTMVRRWAWLLSAAGLLAGIVSVTLKRAAGRRHAALSG